MNNKRTVVNLYKDIVFGDPSTHFLYDIVYQQQQKRRDLNTYRSDGC